MRAMTNLLPGSTRGACLLFAAVLALASWHARADSATNRGPGLVQATEVATIEAAALHERLRSERGRLLVVDVREALFYEDCHLQAATNVPLRCLVEAASRWARDRPIVVYCQDRACDDSRTAARTLAAMGFGRVQAFAGGLRAWRARGYETTGPGQLLDE